MVSAWSITFLLHFQFWYLDCTTELLTNQKDKLTGQIQNKLTNSKIGFESAHSKTKCKRLFELVQQSNIIRFESLRKMCYFATRWRLYSRECGGGEPAFAHHLCARPTGQYRGAVLDNGRRAILKGFFHGFSFFFRNFWEKLIVMFPRFGFNRFCV